jgi:hypothetical protein
VLPTITHADYLQAPVAWARRGGAGIAVVIVGLAVVVAVVAAWATATIPARGVAARPGPTSLPLTAHGPVAERATARSPRFTVVR